MTDRKDLGEGKSTEELRAEIAQTRARVAEDVEAIGNKLSPDNLKREAKDAIVNRVRERTTAMRYGVSHAGTSIADSARSNPLPIALIGIGIGWWLIDARKRANVARQRPYDYADDRLFAEDRFYNRGDYGDYGYGAAGHVEGYGEPGYPPANYEVYGEQHAGRIDRARERARGAADQAKSQVRGAAEDARGRVQELSHQASERAHALQASARQRAAWARDRAREQATWARQQAQTTMNESPLMVGALALAAGLGVGLAIPSSEREDRWFGEHRDELFDRAKEKAQEARGVATETARRTAEAAKDTAKQTAKSEASRRGLVGDKSTSEQSSESSVAVSEVKSVGESWNSSLHSGQNGRSV